MKKFIVLKRDYSEINPSKQFSYYVTIEENFETAAEEASINENSDAQNWVLTKNQLKAILKTIRDALKHKNLA